MIIVIFLYLFLINKKILFITQKATDTYKITQKTPQWCPGNKHKNRTNTIHNNKHNYINTDPDLGDHPVNSEKHNISRCPARANSRKVGTDCPWQ